MRFLLTFCRELGHTTDRCAPPTTISSFSPLSFHKVFASVMEGAILSEPITKHCDTIPVVKKGVLF